MNAACVRPTTLRKRFFKVAVQPSKPPAAKGAKRAKTHARRWWWLTLLLLAAASRCPLWVDSEPSQIQGTVIQPSTSTNGVRLVCDVVLRNHHSLSNHAPAPSNDSNVIHRPHRAVFNQAPMHRCQRARRSVMIHPVQLRALWVACVAGSVMAAVVVPAHAQPAAPSATRP